MGKSMDDRSNGKKKFHHIYKRIPNIITFTKLFINGDFVDSISAQPDSIFSSSFYCYALFEPKGIKLHQKDSFPD
ncbi:hypothetical protein QVD17_23033 [Tagetes erecta]|uniref:Uncharacterized protein n=1 Tax=Tagetes erecta TaxID=13708 RepID=A0AAD8KDY7_TARER|nr:hypothetical protein QVD17_23033 [Tagetes erecta]